MNRGVLRELGESSTTLLLAHMMAWWMPGGMQSTSVKVRPALHGSLHSALLPTPSHRRCMVYDAQNCSLLPEYAIVPPQKAVVVNVIDQVQNLSDNHFPSLFSFLLASYFTHCSTLLYRHSCHDHVNVTGTLFDKVRALHYLTDFPPLRMLPTLWKRSISRGVTP